MSEINENRGAPEEQAAQSPQAQAWISKNPRPSKFRALLVVILVLIIGAGAAYVYVDRNEEPVVQEQAALVEVVITGSGFAPETIIVDSGTTVRWVNSDTQPHAVASNPHPTHDGLDGFESEFFGPDSTYEYTFDSPGTYGYHDEQDPLKNAVVIVQ